MVIFISCSAPETEAIGKQLANDLGAGCVLALKGELGSGKTTFTKGLVTGLGSSTAATSPTFTIVHEYQDGRLPIYHLDFFRLENRESTDGLGFDDYFFSDGICVIEWADRFPHLVPGHARWILFDIKSERERMISLLDNADEDSGA